MEDNKTKEEILHPHKVWFRAGETFIPYDAALASMEVHTQQSTKQLQDELDSWKKEHFEMVEDAANTIKELQDRIVELEIKNQAIESEAIDLLKDRVKELEWLVRLMNNRGKWIEDDFKRWDDQAKRALNTKS